MKRLRFSYLRQIRYKGSFLKDSSQSANEGPARKYTFKF